MVMRNIMYATGSRCSPKEGTSSIRSSIPSMATTPSPRCLPQGVRLNYSYIYAQINAYESLFLSACSDPHDLRYGPPGSVVRCDFRVPAGSCRKAGYRPVPAGRAYLQQSGDRPDLLSLQSAGEEFVLRGRNGVGRDRPRCHLYAGRL